MRKAARFCDSFVGENSGTPVAGFQSDPVGLAEHKKLCFTVCLVFEDLLK